MKLSDLFEQLSQGELRQLAIGGANASGVLAHDYPRVIPHINLGLSELHKRFCLKTKLLVIQQLENIQQYYLHPDHSQTNTTSTKPKYIMDTVYQPFDTADEVLKIEAVFAEDGTQYFLNDSNNEYSLFTPTYNSIQVPYPEESNILNVEYRANHTKLVSNGDYVLDQEIEISPTYLEALLYFIAGRYLSTIGNAESSMDGANFMARFENSCRKIEELNLSVRDSNTNIKLDINGWV